MWSHWNARIYLYHSVASAILTNSSPVSTLSCIVLYPLTCGWTHGYPKWRLHFSTFLVSRRSNMFKIQPWNISGSIVSSLMSSSNISFALLLCPLLSLATWNVDAAIMDKRSRQHVSPNSRRNQSPWQHGAPYQKWTACPNVYVNEK